MKLSLMEKMKSLYHRYGASMVFHLERKQNNPTNIHIDDIVTILMNFPRSRWYDLIKPLIWEEDREQEYLCTINSDIEDNSPVADEEEILHFNLADLIRLTFPIEPGFYIDEANDGIVYCNNYLPLDERYKDPLDIDGKISENHARYIISHGNRPNAIGISNEGKPILDFYYTEINKNDFIYSHNLTYHNYKKINYALRYGEPLYYLKYIAENTDKITDDMFYRVIDCICNHFEYESYDSIRYQTIFKDILHI